ncbi:MAG TPA: hypothetical protein VEO95_01120 [Chthoniobacteraceae bacterium]|nr:hypothetical protein [Chthoniobacteraceae bacterium]
MKKIAYSLVACLAVAGSALAGHEVKETKEYKQPEGVPCFKDTELQLDVFGTYNDTSAGGHTDGFGGGLAINYFFMRYVGIGVDGNVFDGGHDGTWNFSGRLILRYPIELGGLCLAPYIFGGGGYETDGINSGTEVAGGGLEFRIIPEKLGIFAEGSYTWVNASDDNRQARIGVRFVF